jgi:hypothetical protein
MGALTPGAGGSTGTSGGGVLQAMRRRESIREMIAQYAATHAVCPALR